MINAKEIKTEIATLEAEVTAITNKIEALNNVLEVYDDATKAPKYRKKRAYKKRDSIKKKPAGKKPVVAEPKKRGTRPSEKKKKRDEEIVRLVGEGMARRDVAEAMGVSGWTVNQIVKEAGGSANCALASKPAKTPTKESSPDDLVGFECKACGNGQERAKGSDPAEIECLNKYTSHEPELHVFERV